MSALIQNTPEWEEMRKEHIGASDAPIIAGVSPWKTPYRLWQEKVGIIDPEPQTFIQAEGHRKEPLARGALGRVVGVDFEPQVCFHPNIPWMMASVDAVEIDGERIAEIKCPGKVDHQMALNGKVPEKYIPQLQHAMEVCQVEQMIYFSYGEEDWIALDVYRDEEYIKNLIKQEKEFYACMQELKAPPLMDRDYVSVETQTRTELALKWLSLKNSLSALEKEEKELRQALISTSPNHSSIGGGVKITRTLRSGSIDYAKIPELKALNLEQYRKKPIEVWTITPQKEPE